MRIGGFVVNAGSQTIVLDRNVDVEKSNARSGNFPGKLEFSSITLINTQLIQQFAFRHADAVNLALLRAGITQISVQAKAISN